MRKGVVGEICVSYAVAAPWLGPLKNKEIVEDGALGKITKESGYALKMVRGEHLIEALYSRSSKEMWNGLKRLMVPLYHQNSSWAVGVFFAVLFIFSIFSGKGNPGAIF